MAFNLFIAYDLVPPGQNYDRVRDAITKLGVTWKFQQSLYYLHTEYSPEMVYAALSAVTDQNDRIAVINAQSGVVSNWDNPPVDEINALWFDRRVA